MLVKACQCSPTECGTILLMQLSSAFFFHGNALTNVSLACGHQTGKNFCYGTWNLAWLHVLKKKKKEKTWSSHELFNWWVSFGWGFIIDSLLFWDTGFWLSRTMLSIWHLGILLKTSKKCSHIQPTFLPQLSMEKMWCPWDASSEGLLWGLCPSIKHQT